MFPETFKTARLTLRPIQLETKVYKTRFKSSFAFELAATGSSGRMRYWQKDTKILLKMAWR